MIKGSEIRKAGHPIEPFLLDRWSPRAMPGEEISTGKMMMPWANGKMKDMQFKGMGIEGYDNVKKKFVGSWIDNTGTGIYFMDGTYGAATKTFTYNAEMEMMPGMKTKASKC